MPNIDSPFGLRPVRHMMGVPLAATINPYYVDSGDGTALFIGDPVLKVTGGSNSAAINGFPIGTLPSVIKAAAGDADFITGVIVGFMPDPANLDLKHRVASTSRVAYVCDDPFVVFEVQADGAVAAASMGLNANLIFTHAGNTTTGLSGVELDTTSDGPDADASNQLLILRAVNREDNDTTLTHAKVEVIINAHTQNPGSAGALGI